MERDPVGQAGTQQGRTEPCRTAREGAALTLRSSTSPGLQQPQPHSGGVQTSVSPRHPRHQSLQPQPHRRLHGRAPPAPAAPWKRPHAAAPSHPQAAPHPRAVRSLTLGPPPPRGQRSSRPGEDEGPGAAPRDPHVTVTLSRTDRGCGPRALRREPRLFRADLNPVKQIGSYRNRARGQREAGGG